MEQKNQPQSAVQTGQHSGQESTYKYLENLPSAERDFGREFRFFMGGILNRAGNMLNRAFIRVSTRIPLAGHNGINTQELSARMAKIDWNKDYYSENAIGRSANRPRLERDIIRVNRILRDLKTLSDSGDPKAEELRWKLQHKYWTGTKMQGQRSNTREDIVPLAKYSMQPKLATKSNNPTKSEGVQTNKPAATVRQNVEKQEARQARKAKITIGASRLGLYFPRQRKARKGVSL